MRLKRRWWLMLGALVLVGKSAPAWVPQLLVYAPSSSMPLGWYARAFPERDVRVGDLVVVETPESMRAALPAQTPQARLLKAVAGVAGTAVCWHKEGMVVWAPGGTRCYPTQPDLQGEPPLETCRRVGKDEVVLVGWHPRSFDSRYVGTIPLGLVQFRVWPLWTWEAR
jgi:type IV secretory pathway protease TraF